MYKCVCFLIPSFLIPKYINTFTLLVQYAFFRSGSNWTKLYLTKLSPHESDHINDQPMNLMNIHYTFTTWKGKILLLILKQFTEWKVTISIPTPFHLICWSCNSPWKIIWKLTIVNINCCYCFRVSSWTRKKTIVLY